MNELDLLYQRVLELMRTDGKTLLEKKGLLGMTDKPVPGCGKCGGLMLIGEAPGKDETEQGLPFVGKAGRQLDELLEYAGINRSDIYITNTVKYRPYKLSEKGTVSNRPPTGAEIKLYSPLLLEEIALVKPAIVATLGNTPLHALCGQRDVVTGLRGKLRQMDFGPLFPLYHPASVIYDRSKLDVIKQDASELGRLTRGLITA